MLPTRLLRRLYWRLRPGQAVVFAAFFNFIAYFVFHLSVAATIGKGIVLAQRGGYACDFWCSDGRYHLEHHDLVLRHSQ